MTDATAPAPRRGWWRLMLATVLFAGAADLPMLHTILPVQEPVLLVLAMLAVCGLAAWRRGGSSALAVGLLALAVWRIGVHLRGAGSSEQLMIGWTALSAGVFGVALVAARSRRLLSVGVVSVLATVLVGAMLVVVTPAGPASFQSEMDASLAVRDSVDLAAWRKTREEMTKADSTPPDSLSAELFARVEQNYRDLPSVARTVLPSLLALQTLAAMALAWALFHRFSRTRLGEDLSRLREFRFNDQWVWSVIVGLVLTLLPAVASLKPLGINLLVFFGALYALRGAGVLAWFLRPGRSLLGLLVGALLLLLLRDGAAIALGLVGLGDTWVDWRRRIRPAVS